MKFKPLLSYLMVCLKVKCSIRSLFKSHSSFISQKKTEFFDSSLGKLFYELGMNLVQASISTRSICVGITGLSWTLECRRQSTRCRTTIKSSYHNTRKQAFFKRKFKATNIFFEKGVHVFGTFQ